MATKAIEIKAVEDGTDTINVEDVVKFSENIEMKRRTTE
jgi:hypothetical protein